MFIQFVLCSWIWVIVACIHIYYSQVALFFLQLTVFVCIWLNHQNSKEISFTISRFFYSNFFFGMRYSAQTIPYIKSLLLCNEPYLKSVCPEFNCCCCCCSWLDSCHWEMYLLKCILIPESNGCECWKKRLARNARCMLHVIKRIAVQCIPNTHTHTQNDINIVLIIF